MLHRPVSSTAPVAMLAAVAQLAASTPAQTDDGASLQPVEITEWPVPYPGRARDPFVVGPDEVWFVGQSYHYLARFTPSSGAFFRRDLPDEAGPHNLVVGSDGVVWYAGNRRGYIGCYDPETDRIEKIPMPDPAAGDPHTLVFDAREAHLWFTVQHGNFIGRLRLADHHVELVPVTTPSARPYGIRMGPDGRPWIVLLGSNRLASVDPQTLALTEIVIPAENARPRRLEVGGDGRVWYTDWARGFLGVYDPARGAFDEVTLPGGADSRPYGTARDGSGRVWVVETGVRPNRFVGVDMRTGRVVSVTPVPSGAGSVRHMDYHGPTGTVWFGTDERTLGRALVEPRD